MSALALALALAFVWTGLLLGLSFIEAPLKFRAPGVTLPLGLGIGRLVFRVLHAVELVLAAAILVSLIIGASAGLPGLAGFGLALAVCMLLAQLVLVQPRLTRRSDAVLAGEDAPRSRAHHAYVVLELVKVIGLLLGAITLLARFVSLAA